MRNEKKPGGILRVFLPLLILLAFLSTAFFGFLLYGSIKSYFAMPGNAFMKTKIYTVRLLGKSERFMRGNTSGKTIIEPDKAHKIAKPQPVPVEEVKLQDETVGSAEVEVVENAQIKLADAAEEKKTNKTEIEKSVAGKIDKPEKPGKKMADVSVKTVKKSPAKISDTSAKDKSGNLITEELLLKPRAKSVTITYKNPAAKSVSVMGSFSSWSPIEMKSKDGIWEVKIYLFSGKYRYNFEVDGKKILDPLTSLTSNDSSVLIVP